MYIFFGQSRSLAQCSAPYTSYPVTFNFETNNGGWFSGGSSSDWQWGHSSKQVINGAASGQNCWITGGLTGSSYNGSERSWLQSPNCFDFSNNTNPYIEFKVFWETERQYDGAGFQYSTDYGASWQNVGSLGDDADFMNKNWFNGSVTNLTGLAGIKIGWSGNIQSSSGSCLGGNGSGAWVTARHQLYFLAGKTHVQFRFIFGSGSTCNAYDGFAVDDVTLSNTPPGPEIINTDVTNVKCFGTETGAAAATVSNGITPYIYTWTNGSNTYTGASIINLPFGNYRLVVSDANNCKDTFQFPITEPPALNHTVTYKDATCGQSNGLASIAETGGQPPYKYVWSPAVSTGTSASGLAAGSYAITITDAANCADTFHINIDVRGGLSATISNITNASCFGVSNGSLTASANGTGPFTYAWSPSGGNEAIANNLAAGVYGVLITDGSGCTIDVSAQVDQPAEINATIAKEDATCNTNNGKVTASVSGGQGPYTYLWTPGNYTTSGITDLAPGPYTLTVKDAAGCEKTLQAVIGSSAGPKITAITHTNVLCFGQSNGSANATVSGGTAPYVYSWVSGGNSYSGGSLQNLPTGSYQLTVTDAKGCSASGDVSINQPASLSHAVFTVSITCTNATGSANITESGSTQPYSYSWSPSGGSSSSASGLTPGNYVVTITDNNQCTDSAHVQITNTSPVSAEINNVTNVSCNAGNDGSASVTANGSSPFSYSWAPSGGTASVANNLIAGSYTVFVTDKDGCITSAAAKISQPELLVVKISTVNTSCGNDNGSAGASAEGGTNPFTFSWTNVTSSSPDISSLTAGIYTVYVSDAKGCIATGQATVLASTSPAISSINYTNALCYSQASGSANALVTSGTAPYTYSWKNASAIYAGNPLQNIAAGSYQLTVTDAAGCLANGNVTIGEPANLNHSISATASTCGNSNGAGAIKEIGGTAPYTFAWLPGDSNNSTASGLAAGDYVVTIIDKNQCTDTANVTILNIGGISATVTGIKDVSCFGGSNGSAEATATGDATPFSYSWSSAGGNLALADNLKAGDYIVTVTDTQGCAATASARVNQPQVLQISIGNDTTICPGGVVTLKPGNFVSYNWQDNTHDSIYKAVRTGIYTVAVTDSMGCVASASRKVDVNCMDLLFPNAFTPNGDQLNDGFGPSGTLSAVKNYTLRVYDRWGQLVFYTNTPSKKWKGNINSAQAGSGTFVWMAQYSFNGQPKRLQKGTILLLK